MSRFESLDLDHALRLIIEGTAAETGQNFYSALVKALAATLNTSGAWVTEYLPEPERLRALAFQLNGKWIPDYEYEIPGTPCETVIKQAKTVHIAENVTQLFPDDADLSAFGAVSYLGMPLLDVDGTVLGHLAILDTKPLPADSRLMSFFRIFAIRAAAEHRRLRAEKEVREREAKLDRLIGSAMDAILELDEEFNITLANSAATDAFILSRAELLSRNFKDLLPRKSLQTFLGIIEQLNSANGARQHIWIPTGIEATRSDGQVFPVEATVSLSVEHRRRFYTIILRNVNEREEALRQIEQLTEQAEYLKAELKAAQNFDEIIGGSEVISRVLHDVDRVAITDTTVLILGETGTGKELIATAIHKASRRADKPLIRVNCAALPANLIESELFGHEKGAFTGATAKRSGRFLLAHGGTIFLDEVGELPLELQAKLLRVLQEREFEPVGGSKTIKVDVRVIAATNRDLEKSVAAGQFREDLYYRLNVFPIMAPPLRERTDDIGPLANAFLKRASEKLGRTMEPFSADAIARLNAYDWPGNVRELQNVVERSVIVAEHRRPNLERALPSLQTIPASSTDTDTIITVGELEALEKRNLLAALQACKWKVAGDNGAAKLLGMKPSTLNSRISALKIKKPQSIS
ncbi:MAG TPA: sigma 54-interacting transcriptional regulator [Pyrinomonadaceae bacterium]|nr:sigma 54-interacting transcriptional regulator [Pyrinomonadaceae bacterium]